MNSARLKADPGFRQGDGVSLAEGTYQGTVGVFLRLRPDANWEEIKERNGAVRCHPVMWLRRTDPLEETALGQG